MAQKAHPFTVSLYLGVHFIVPSPDIDMFIGVNTSYHQDVDITTLASDEIMLIISSKLLHRQFDSKEIKKMQKGVDITRFADIPFTLSFKTGKVNRVIEEYLDYQNLHLNVVYNISDSETQILLCAAGICASLCPRMLLSTAFRHNLANDESNQVYMLPIRNLNRPLRVDIACHKNVIYPVYARKFIDILKEEVPRIAEEYK